MTPNGDVCATCGIQHCFWQAFDTPEIRELRRLRRLIVREPDEVLFREGEPALAVYLVLTGTVMLGVHAPGGKVQSLRLVTSGDFLGDAEVLDGREYSFFAQTVELSSLCVVDRHAFVEAIKSHPKLGMQLTQKLAREVKLYASLLAEASYASSEEKMTRLLRSLGRRFGKATSRGVEINLSLSRATLASLVGMSTETGIRILRDLEKRKQIQIEGRTIIL